VKAQWSFPLDPECPANPMEAFYDDPMTEYSGMGDEIGPLLASKHRAKCARCRAYGAANVEVDA
jgi:hypothetical protein